MPLHYIFSVVWVTRFLSTDGDTDACPDDSWVRLGMAQNCYKFSNELRTWDQANGHCRAMGAHLLTIETEEEAAAIAAYIMVTENANNGKLGTIFALCNVSSFYFLLNYP